MTKAITAHCNHCGGMRNHDVLHSVKSEWSDAEEYCCGSNEYETLRCAGCEDIKLRHISRHSDDEEPTIHYFPPLIFRQKPVWFEELYFEVPKEEHFIEVLLNEIYVAVQNNLSSLALMGVRSLLEKIMIAKIGDKNSFAKNLDELLSKGFVSPIQKQNLSTIVEAGHAATHRKYKPRKEDIITALDITEHIIESVYFHSSKVLSLKNRIPKRESASQEK